jgi:hypothetical protein
MSARGKRRPLPLLRRQKYGRHRRRDHPRQKTKALIRELVAELKVNSKTEILPSYYLATPVVCATSEKVGREGIEPSTLGLRVPCSTS